LRDLGAQFQERDIGKEPLSAAELQTLIGSADAIEFLNTRSAAYRAQGFKAQPPTKAQAIQLMVRDPNLMKRPITVKGQTKVLGFDAAKLKNLVAST
jgi:arsenate reductase-like glutaredoxin family protein